MALDAGTLRVTLNFAKDLKDCDWFGRQDPYVKLHIGSQERRSQVCRDGGRSPVWNETFEFSVINENTLELTLMDYDTFSRDDLIGTCSVSLAKVRSQGADVVQAPVSCGKKVQKQQGFVQVTLSFTPNSMLRPSASFAQPAATLPVQAAPPAYGYPAASQGACVCAHPPHPAPGGYAYPPPAPAPAYAPAASGYYTAPSYHYSPSFGAPAPGYGAPPPQPQAPAYGYGAPPPQPQAPGYGAPPPQPQAPGYGAPPPSQPPPPGYGAPPPQPSYYPPPPTASAPGYGQYYGAAPYGR